MSFHPAALQRIITGELASTEADGQNGAFQMPSPEPGWWLFVVASDGLGWDHVSVHARRAPQPRRSPALGDSGASRVPTWREMCAIKAACWDPDDVVVQYHPRAADYVNMHPNVLHLWRPQALELPTPDPAMVGVR